MYRPLDLHVDDKELMKNPNKTSSQFARKTSVYSRNFSSKAATAAVNDVDNDEDDDDDDDDDDSMDSDNVGDDVDDPIDTDDVGLTNKIS